jgi:hypothetical protein
MFAAPIGGAKPQCIPGNYDAINEKENTMVEKANATQAFTPRLLVQSSAKFHINAPTSAIDITDWLFNVDDAEYIDCTPQSRSHLSAGLTHAPNGKRMSINVEDVGGAPFHHQRVHRACVPSIPASLTWV